MRSIPQVWRQAYIAGNHNYVVTINMTLADGTTLTIGNDDIWEGGFSIEEGTSDENTFSIGSAIIGKCTVILNNISEKFSGYDFYNAEFNAYLNLVGLSTQNLRIGHYTVDETAYNGSLITLTALNNMWRFDIPFSDINYTFTSSTTARDVVNAMCQYAGIGIILATQQFQGYNFKLAKPEQDLNCREVLQYIAQATCNYCVINDVGNLELRWYDKSAILNIEDWDGGTFNTTTTPYSDGCNRDGGRWYWDGETYVWTQGDDADGGYFYDNTSTIGYITNNNSIEVGTDQIVVTGVKVCSSNQDNDKAYDYSWHDGTLEQTYPRYTLVIQDNVFINKSNAQERTLALGDILKNLHLRSFRASSVNDISIEAGDPVAISDHRGNRFYTFVTNVRFQTNNFESFSCGVESITQNKVVRYSNEIKTLVEAQRNAQELVSTYDQAVQRMNNIAVNAMGAYEAYEEVADARIYYLSNKPISKNAQGKCVFTAGSTVFKLTGDGFFVSTNGGQTFVNGYSGGELVVNVLNAIGINADWINAGHITASRIQGGTLTLGGKSGSLSDVNGVCSVLDTTNTERVRLDSNGIKAVRGYIGNGSSGWTIQDTSIYNGCNSISSTTNGTYVGTNGFRNKSGAYIVTITGGGVTANYGNIGGLAIDSTGIGVEASALNASRINSGGTFAFCHKIGGSWTSLDYNANSNSIGLWTAGSTQSGGGLDVSGGSKGEYSSGWIRWGWSDGERSDGYQVSWHSGSDRRLKKNIVTLPISKVRKFFKKINPIKFNYNKASRANELLKHYGIIAQEIEDIFEEIGETNTYIVEDKDVLRKDERGNEYTENYKYVNYEEFHGWELAGIKDLYEIVQTQQEEIDLLKQEVALLKEKVGV